MVYTEANAEIIGVIFLYHIFNEMAEIEEKKNRVNDQIIYDHEPNRDIEMDNIRDPLLR